jgi:hypothetical protein
LSSGEERIVFADQVIKFSRRMRPERRDFVITVVALYLVMRAIKNNVALYKLTKRVTMNQISGVELSTLQDTLVLIHCDDVDLLLENSHRTELVTVLAEYYEAATGRKLNINFTDKYFFFFTFIFLFIFHVHDFHSIFV